MAPSLSFEVDGEVSWRSLLGEATAEGATLALVLVSSASCVVRRVGGRRYLLARRPSRSRGGAAGAWEGVRQRRRLGARTVIYRSTPVSSTTGLPRPSTGGLTCTGSSTSGAWRGSFKVDGRGLARPLEIGSVD